MSREKKTLWLKLVLQATILSGCLLHAQSQELFVLPRLEGSVRLDGLSDEPAWQAVEPLPLTMYQPVFGGTLTERSEIRVAYNDEYLYAAGRFYDSDPSGIRGNVLVRDGLSRNASDDQFALILDTFNDNENALAFFTNPAGSRSDAVVANDAERAGPGMPWNTSWNNYWDVVVVKKEEGWFAEMRIPFSSLRFQDQEGRVVMGLITWRKIGRKNEFQSFPAIPPKWSWGRMKPSIARNVVFEGIYSRKPLYITPYILTGGSNSFALDSAQTDYVAVDGDPVRDLGLDIKYGLTSNLTLDLTVNTDFAQVEADNERVNLTRFSLFFPEKRLFFQERSSVFDFSTGGETRLFYSRRIGLSDQGPVPIIGGARLVGRIGDWDIGLLDMQTARTEFQEENDSIVTIPSENFGVLSLRRQVLNPFSYVGGILTSRVGRDGSYNYAYGLDGILRLFGDDYITYVWAQTYDDQCAQQAGHPPITSGRLRATWERRTDQGLGYDVDLLWSGPDYDPGIGFTKRSDISRIRTRLSYGLYPKEHPWIYRHAPEVSTAIYWRNADGFAEEMELALEWSLRTIKGGSSRLQVKGVAESLIDTFYLSQEDSVYVPPNTDEAPYYTYVEASLSGTTPRSNLISTRYRLNIGTYYDGTRLTVSAGPSWVVSPMLELGGEYQINRIVFTDRDQLFQARIARLRVKAAFSPVLSASAFVQYNSKDDAIGTNLRLRYNPREGTDLYLVYDENLNTDRNREVPALPPTSNRTILLKYSTTFQPRLAWTAR